MKIIAWNCRGASSREFLRHLQSLLAQFKPDVLFLMETRSTSDRAVHILNKTYFTNLYAVEARGSAGGLWCFWNTNMVNLTYIACTNQCLSMAMAVMKGSEIDWILTMLYASPIPSARNEFWDYLTRFHDTFNLPWCLLGDFNQVVFQRDKQPNGNKVPSPHSTVRESTKVAGQAAITAVCGPGTKYRPEESSREGESGRVDKSDRL